MKIKSLALSFVLAASAFSSAQAMTPECEAEIEIIENQIAMLEKRFASASMFKKITINSQIQNLKVRLTFVKKNCNG